MQHAVESHIVGTANAKFKRYHEEIAGIYSKIKTINDAVDDEIKEADHALAKIAALLKDTYRQLVVYHIDEEKVYGGSTTTLRDIVEDYFQTEVDLDEGVYDFELGEHKTGTLPCRKLAIKNPYFKKRRVIKKRQPV